MNLLPKDTFIYDEIPVEELEKQYDFINFFNDVDVGLTVADFNLNKKLKPFVPVATFESTETTARSDEFVAVVEGNYMPFFGVASRLDKI